MNPMLFAMCRVLTGLSQSDFAELLNVRQATISRYETAETPIPQKRLEKIVDILLEAGVSETSIMLIQAIIESVAMEQTRMMMNQGEKANA